MGFNTVYRCLMEMFPQIDARLLKAVAIEHSKDADAAANDVLTDILPSWSKQALPMEQSASSSKSKSQSASGGHSDGDEGAENEEQSTLRRRLVVRRRNKALGSSPEPGSLTSGYATNTDLACVYDSDSISLNKALNASTVSQFYNANGGSSQISGITESGEVILLGKTQEIGVEYGSNEVSTAMTDALRNYEGGVEVGSNKISTAMPDAPMNYEGEVCANTESVGSVSLGKGQDICVKVDHFGQLCAESNDSVSLDKGQDINVNVDDFSQDTGSNDSVSMDKGQDFNVKVDDFSQDTESNDSVSLDKGQDINVKVDDFSQYTESNDSVSSDKGEDIIVNVDPEQTAFLTSTCLVNVNSVTDGTLTDGKYFDGPGTTSIDTSSRGLSYLVESCLDCHFEKVESSIAQSVQSSVQKHTSDVQECGLQSEIGSGSPCTDCGKTDSCGSSVLTSEQENFLSKNGNDNIEDESTFNSQVCKIDLLEEMIEDAKNNKKTLFMAMESVMNLVREVEIQEKAAEEAKEEAEKGGLEILVKVEELKQMLAHAKEANDMHAGEIYGEKAILFTEARELQNRLLSLSEERNKSLAILEEMHEALKARLAAAEEIRKAAEQEKLEKDESARNYLAEQEAVMEKVVQESKILQNHAEENSKLQEFLMDRGRVVDSLQGEISVICQDVRLLKEKFDEPVLLGKSVSSSQTTCILSSSGSSIKSMASLVAEQGLTSKTPEKMGPSPSVEAQSPKSKLEDRRTRDLWRELSDEWDFFENDPELNIKAP